MQYRGGSRNFKTGGGGGGGGVKDSSFEGMMQYFTKERSYVKEKVPTRSRSPNSPEFHYILFVHTVQEGEPPPPISDLLEINLATSGNVQS